MVQAISYQSSAPLTEDLERFWNLGAVRHYASALRRCMANAAKYCLVLDDDVVASAKWARSLHLAIDTLNRRDARWTMVKVFQPVWGNERMQWHGWNILKPFLFSLALVSLLWLLWCALLFVKTVPQVGGDSAAERRERSILGAGAAVICWPTLSFTLLSLGKANLELLFGDGHVHPYGTCAFAQANMFHRERVEAAGLEHFLQRLANRSSGWIPPIDLSICDLFEAHAQALGPMWAVTPSIFQHVGFRTSHPTKGQHCPVGLFHEGLWEGGA